MPLNRAVSYYSKHRIRIADLLVLITNNGWRPLGDYRNDNFAYFGNRGNAIRVDECGVYQTLEPDQEMVVRRHAPLSRLVIHFDCFQDLFDFTKILFQAYEGWVGCGLDYQTIYTAANIETIEHNDLWY